MNALNVLGVQSTFYFHYLREATCLELLNGWNLTSRRGSRLSGLNVRECFDMKISFISDTNLGCIIEVYIYKPL